MHHHDVLDSADQVHSGHLTLVRTNRDHWRAK